MTTRGLHLVVRATGRPAEASPDLLTKLTVALSDLGFTRAPDAPVGDLVAAICTALETGGFSIQPIPDLSPGWCDPEHPNYDAEAFDRALAQQFAYDGWFDEEPTGLGGPPPIPDPLLETIDRRLDEMLAHPVNWGSAEAFELQALALLELRNRPTMGLAAFGSEYSSFLAIHYPSLGARPLSSHTGEFEDIAVILRAFRVFLGQKQAMTQYTVSMYTQERANTQFPSGGYSVTSIDDALGVIRQILETQPEVVQVTVAVKDEFSATLAFTDEPPSEEPPSEEPSSEEISSGERSSEP